MKFVFSVLNFKMWQEKLQSPNIMGSIVQVGNMQYYERGRKWLLCIENKNALYSS